MLGVIKTSKYTGVNGITQLTHITSKALLQNHYLLHRSYIRHRLDKNLFVFLRCFQGGLPHELYHIYTPNFLYSEGLTESMKV